jgi:hypothetical protein
LDNSKDTKSQNKQAGSRKKSYQNLFLNVIIILLSLFILYMGYSIYAKLSKKEVLADQNVKNAPRSEIIQVEVLNGSGVSGLTDKAVDFLRKNKFDVVSKGNYESFDVLETLVIDRTGNTANAEAVAKALGVKTKIVQQLNSNYLLDVTVVIGKDYFNFEAFK